MLDIIPEALAQYVHDHTSAGPSLLDELRAETLETLEMPQMQVGRVEGQLLRMLTQLSGARRAIEIGTYSGYSGLSIASGLPQDGTLITCDVDPTATAVAQRYFDRSPHGSKIELRLGHARDTLSALADSGARFDLAFIDADKENYVHYWDAILPMLEVGGLILVDNTLWSGKVLHPTEPSDHGIVAFNDHVGRDARVEHVLLSVRDGIMMARKQPS